MKPIKTTYKDLLNRINSGAFKLKDDEEVMITFNIDEEDLGSSLGSKSIDVDDYTENKSASKTDMSKFATDKKIAETSKKAEKINRNEKETQEESGEQYKKSLSKYSFKKFNSKQNIITANSGYLQKIKNILKDNIAFRPNGNKRSGDLDTKHIYRIFTSGRGFSEKEINALKEYSICLLVDCSGSMRHYRDTIAAKSVMGFIKEFQNIVDLSVIGFNMEIFTLKQFKRKLSDEEILKVGNTIYDAIHSNEAICNHDGGAIKVARESIQKYSSKSKKIIIVISDGEPACGCSKKHLVGSNLYINEKFKNELYSSSYLKYEVSKTIKEKIVCLGIGIQCSSVSEYYPFYDIIDEPSKIFPSIMKLLNIHIKKAKQ